MSDVTLVACPFCNGLPRVVATAAGHYAAVECNDCGARGPNVVGSDYEAKLRAAEKWNKRGGFGSARVSIANEAVPVETYKYIERVRETAERLEKGELGEPTCGVLIHWSPDRKNITITALRTTPAIVEELVRQVFKNQQTARSLEIQR